MIKYKAPFKYCCMRDNRAGQKGICDFENPASMYAAIRHFLHYGESAFPIRPKTAARIVDSMQSAMIEKKSIVDYKGRHLEYLYVTEL